MATYYGSGWVPYRVWPTTYGDGNDEIYTVDYTGLTEYSMGNPRCPYCNVEHKSGDVKCKWCGAPLDSRRWL